MPQHATLLGETPLAIDSQDVSVEVGQSVICRIGKPIYAASQINDAPRVSNYSNERARAAGLLATDTNSFTAALIGRSPQMLHLHSLIKRIAPTDSSTLIMGATGTGKELVARAIHQQSARCHAPFIDINCSAIPDTLFEAEFFGHQRGSFTGAHETRRGLLEAAAGGTLFLDEVDALSLSAQAKLLRVLQERQVRRVGGRENISLNVRIISASNHNLQNAVASGAFRADLLFRLRVVPLHLPELHERGEEDLRLLIQHFLHKHAERNGVRQRHFAPGVRQVLMAHRWPGNVRELENVIEYALAIGTGEELTVNDLPSELLEKATKGPDLLEDIFARKASLAEIERCYILFMLESFGGNQLKAAEALGIDRRTLYRKLKAYHPSIH